MRSVGVKNGVIRPVDDPPEAHVFLLHKPDQSETPDS